MKAFASGVSAFSAIISETEVMISKSWVKEVQDILCANLSAKYEGKCLKISLVSTLFNDSKA